MKSEAELMEQLAVKGRELVAVLSAAIEAKERELSAMRERHAGITEAIGLNGAEPTREPRVFHAKTGAQVVVAGVKVPASAVRPSGAKKGKGKLSGIDWGEVLARLPRAFSYADIDRALPAKTPVQSRTMAVARWMRFGRIAKVGAGEYRKIGPGSRSGLPAKPADTQGLDQL